MQKDRKRAYRNRCSKLVTAVTNWPRAVPSDDRTQQRGGAGSGMCVSGMCAPRRVGALRARTRLSPHRLIRRRANAEHLQCHFGEKHFRLLCRATSPAPLKSFGWSTYFAVAPAPHTMRRSRPCISSRSRTTTTSSFRALSPWHSLVVVRNPRARAARRRRPSCPRARAS